MIFWFKLANMTKIIALFTSFYLFLSFSIIPKKNYQLECVSISIDGYVTVKIWDSKKGIKYSSDQARKDAIDAILFSGISGVNGCTTQSPILNIAEEKVNFTAIQKTFFAKNGKWTIFTTNSALETTLPVSLGIQNWKVYQVSISKNELRKYLEDKKIIKSLTNGF